MTDEKFIQKQLTENPQKPLITLKYRKDNITIHIQKQDVKVWTGFIWLMNGPVTSLVNTIMKFYGQ
jgi:hypothetical protein